MDSPVVHRTDQISLFVNQGNNESDRAKSDVNSNSISETKVIQTYTTVTQIELVDPKDTDADIVILRKDPTTRRHLINKSAYAKLHRTLSPGRNSNTIDSLKEKYETNAKPDLIDVSSDTKNEEIKHTEPAKPQKLPVAKLDDETVQSLKNKYSPASFGYPKIAPKPSKLPLAKPRSAVKSQIILPSNSSDKGKSRYSLNVDKRSRSKDENSNELHRKNSSSSGEFVTIIPRSESEGSVDKWEKELNLFEMDTKPKDKKRTNSFRKIFSGKLFGKDKKKKEEEKNKVQLRENLAYADNLQNETNSFNRQANYRHTVGGNSNVKPKETRPVIRSDSDRYSNHQNQLITKEMEDRYAQMHVNQFNHIKQAFEPTNPSSGAGYPTEGYVRMDKPIVKNNPGPTNYMNLPSVRKYIDTSSSASTLESDRSNNKNDLAQNNRQPPSIEQDIRNDNFNSLKSVRFESNKENNRDTPPRAQELRQDVRLVNPKALIPINSERALPNPYQNSNSSTLDKPAPNLQFSQTDSVDRTGQHGPRFEDTYGIVFDSIEQKNRIPLTKTNELKTDQKPPRSPSFEATKLKLPPNREIVPLSPRVKSPIPHDNISTEKIIATELLKTGKSPTLPRKGISKLSSPSHQKLEIDIDYPDNISNERYENRTNERPPLAVKPPLSKIPSRISPEASSSSANSLTRQSISQNSPAFDNRRLSQASPASENLENTYARYRRSETSPFVESQERIITNALVHVNSNIRSPTPNSVLHNRPLSPSARSSTPNDLRSSPTTKSSPQKEDMRRNVEAYYWKEIKKLKDQENYDMYLYQMQLMPYGYAEEPVSVRRSRSLSPTAHRNSRRSLSLPRDPRPNNAVKEIPDMYGRIQPAPIPEGRAVVNPQRNVIYGQLQYQPNFRRNAPERRTIDSTPRNYENYNSYRPIFKRGSLTTPVREQEENPNKKVSFSGSDSQSLQAWPTRNGFTQSPPQRRIDNNRISSIEDEVFLPTTPRTPIKYDGNEIYGYVNKPNVRYEYSPNPNEVLYYSRQNMENSEPLYDRNPRYIVTYPEEDNPYGQTADTARPPYRLTRHGSMQLQEPMYDQRQMNSRRRSFENGQIRPLQEPQYLNKQSAPRPNQVNARIGIRREIILNDEIFGQFGGYVHPNNEEVYFQNRQNPVYASKQSVNDSLYGRTGPKQVSVRNKVCDIYGQIHEPGSPTMTSPTQIRRTGVLMGQLQSNPSSPQVSRQSYGQLSNEQFARNTRLTASANDMYRRYQNTDPRYRSDVVYDGTRYQPQKQQQEIVAPTRPLPPVPMKKGLMRNNSGRSDTDSDASEMQKVNIGAKNKKRSFFGK